MFSLQGINGCESLVSCFWMAMSFGLQQVTDKEMANNLLRI